MSDFRHQVAAGAHDDLLVGRSPRITSLVDPDPVLMSIEAARVRHEATGDLREAILSGPQAGTGLVGTPGSNRVAALAAEDTGWQRAGDGGEVAEFYAGDLESARRYNYWLMAHHPIAMGIIGHYVNLTIGEGVRVVWKGSGAATSRTNWKRKARAVKWDRRLKKTMRHTYALGEWFTLKLPMSGSVKWDVRAERLILSQGSRRRVNALRGVDGGAIKQVITQGDRVYDPKRADMPDAENILGYLRSGLSPEEAEIIHPNDVVHHRFLELGNLTRSPSVFHSVYRYLRYTEKFVQDRYFLNHIRSRIPLIRKVSGGQAVVNAASLQTTRLPPPGSLITENGSTTYQFPEMNIDAREVSDDFDTLIKMIAMGVGLPFYILTQDPSTTNYAALMASDSPTVAHFEGLQSDLWRPDLETLVADLTGAIPGEEFDVVFGSPIKRNVKTIADAVDKPVAMGVMSRRTAAEWLDLDYDEERARIEEEVSDEMGFRTSDPRSHLPDLGGRPRADDDPGLDRDPRPSE